MGDQGDRGWPRRARPGDDRDGRVRESARGGVREREGSESVRGGHEGRESWTSRESGRVGGCKRVGKGRMRERKGLRGRVGWRAR